MPESQRREPREPTFSQNVAACRRLYQCHRSLRPIYRFRPNPQLRQHQSSEKSRSWQLQLRNRSPTPPATYILGSVNKLWKQNCTRGPNCIFAQAYVALRYFLESRAMTAELHPRQRIRQSNRSRIRTGLMIYVATTRSGRRGQTVPSEIWGADRLGLPRPPNTAREPAAGTDKLTQRQPSPPNTNGVGGT